MKRKIIKKYKLLPIIIAAAIAYSLYLIMFFRLSEEAFINSKALIYILSYLGWVLYVFYIISWKNKTGRFIDVYTIFITIFFLFNYGQCLLWAFGIHSPADMLNSRYSGKYLLSTKSIILSQLLTLMSSLAIHLGASLSYEKKDKKTNNNFNESQNAHFKKILYAFSNILLLVVTPITIFVAIMKAKASLENGYLYLYGENFDLGIFDIISRLFIPCMYARLFACDFEKKILRKSYFFIAIYLLISLFIGARGTIIYIIAIMAVVHHLFVKRFTIRKIFLYIIPILLLIFGMSIIRNTRDYGVNFNAAKKELAYDTLIFDGTFEMGMTMGCQAVLLQEGYHNVYPYGNTYINGLIGIITDKAIKVIKPDYISLSEWFSGEYLKITWGAGFSMVSEALLNFGPYLAPLCLIMVGLVVGTANKNFDSDYCSKKLKAFLAFYLMLTLIRGTFPYCIKEWFFNMVIIYGGCYIYNLFKSQKALRCIKTTH